MGACGSLSVGVLTQNLVDLRFEAVEVLDLLKLPELLLGQDVASQMQQGTSAFLSTFLPTFLSTFLSTFLTAFLQQLLPELLECILRVHDKRLFV